MKNKEQKQVSEDSKKSSWISKNEASELLHKFFNHKSDANKYLEASQQEELENEFKEFVVNS